jgi:hypothetical protein
MSCAAGDTFRIDPTGTPITVGESYTDVCKATQILDKLHQDFTEKYATSASIDTIKHKPSFHLRNQPTSLLISGETGAAPTNRFYTVFTTKSEGEAPYNGVVSAILKGAYDTSTEYKTYPNAISEQTGFSSPDAFKGVYGLHKVNEILESKIKAKVDSLNVSGGTGADNVNVSDFNKYQKRQGIKMTMEEIAYRENQIYREKFLNIILVIVGIFIVSTQLVTRYFSYGDGGGGFGFGGVSGWLSTRFGSGGGGLFSRFGGIGLGSSGRSRIGNLFTSSPYVSSSR